jgi:hypothetical protein
MGYMNSHAHNMKSFNAAELTDHIFGAAAEVRIDGVLLCRATNSVLKSKSTCLREGLGRFEQLLYPTIALAKDLKW